ncbi:hypothetical protein [Vibrio tapetis]|uniref:Uncharacterized protein n=1 Tax=Vibrio tapetis subsp. tapetis TaxID=1671868 RepID=A0A2N8ZJY4_9VIBR|nr:hypothetical protein [Vibrio tapetis]SON52221.1 conserved exported protein of unknown function [Vibrio tapetis subsp. tapetis]
MKACKLILLIALLLFPFSSVFALDCETEKKFSITKDHWLHKVEPELQFYSIFYLSSKIVNDCLNEIPSQDISALRIKLIETVGSDMVVQIETEYDYLFDTKDAFRELELNIMDEAFLDKLRSHEFSSNYEAPKI